MIRGSVTPGRRLYITALVTLALAVVPGSAEAAVKAGVAVVDASWHVGASAGQYASDGTLVGEHGVDPNTHSIRAHTSLRRASRG